MRFPSIRPESILPIILAISISFLLSCGGGGAPAAPAPIPVVVSVSPSPGSTAVALNASVSITFDTPMEENSFGNGGLVVLDNTGGSVSGTVLCQAELVTFTPTLEWASGVTYTVRIDNTIVRSKRGVYPGATLSWTFIGGDFRAPAVATVSPVDNASGVDTQPTITVTFDDDIDPATVVPGTITLADDKGATIRCVINVPDNRTITMVPEVLLGPGSRFTATLLGTVADRPGNSIAASVRWSFQTRTWRWSAPMGLDTAPIPPGSAPSIAMDCTGSATVAWGQPSASRSFVQTFTLVPSSAIWTQGSSVPDAFLIWTETGRPLVSSSVAGEPIVVWQAVNVGTNTRLLYVARMGSSAWTSPYLLATANSAAWDFSPAIATDNAGNAAVVWLSIEAGGIAGVTASRFAVSTATWNTPTRIDSGIGTCSSPDVSLASSGRAATVWTVGGRVQGATASSGNASFGISETIILPGVLPSVPKVLLDDQEVTTYVWIASSTGRGVVQTVRREPDAALGPVELTNLSGSALDYDVKVLAGDGLLLAWRQNDGATSSIRAKALYDRLATRAWSSETILDYGTGVSTVKPSVAATKSSRAMISWIRNGASSGEVVSSTAIAPFDGAWSAYSSVFALPFPAQSPNLVMDDNGFAVLAWLQSDGTRQRVFASRRY